MDTLDYAGLRKALSEDPSLANTGLPYDERNTALAHPLHRVCDGVIAGRYTDEQAVELARVLLAGGADINGGMLVPLKDTPLIAAASLYAEQVGIWYVDQGADIRHAGTHGGTALHWAAWVGRDKLVSRLITAGADIHQHCVDFDCTPLYWAVHGYKFGGGRNRHHQVACVRLLLEAGAESHVFNVEGTPVREFLDPGDAELLALLG